MEHIRIYDTVSELSDDYKLASANYTEPWLSYVKENQSTDFNVKPIVTIVLETGEVLEAYDEEGKGITEVTADTLQEPGWNRTAQNAGFKTQKLLYQWIEDNWNYEDNSIVDDLLRQYFPSAAGSTTPGKAMEELGSQYFQGSSTYGPISVLRIGKGVETITGQLTGGFDPSKIVLPSTFNKVEFISDMGHNLEKLILKTSTPPSTVNAHIFANMTSVNNELIIIVPEGSRSDYVADTKWGELAQHIVEVEMNS